SRTEFREARDSLEGWLCGCREHDTRAVVGAELSEAVEDRSQEMGRQGLGLVEDDDALSESVQLPRGAGGLFKETLKELDGRCDDDRRIPVFGREALPDTRWIELVVLSRLL